MKEASASFGLSQRRLCRITGWNRSSMQYRLTARPDEAVRERMRYWAARKPRWGLPILHDILKSEGVVINRKRTARIYREEGLSLRRKRRRKLPALARVPLPAAMRPNDRWSMDFIHDQLAGGRRFRCLNIVDDCTRQCLAIQVDTSIGGAYVADVLDTICDSVGTPRSITCDNGPEFTGKAIHLWAQHRRVHLDHIQPGKPTQNAFVESFNGTFRDDCLNQHWFSSLEEARLLINHWRQEYNNLRPHSSVGRIPPDAFALTFTPNPPDNQDLYPAVA
jgi:putative transposase